MDKEDIEYLKEKFNPQNTEKGVEYSAISRMLTEIRNHNKVDFYTILLTTIVMSTDTIDEAMHLLDDLYKQGKTVLKSIDMELVKRK